MSSASLDGVCCSGSSKDFFVGGGLNRSLASDRGLLSVSQSAVRGGTKVGMGTGGKRGGNRQAAGLPMKEAAGR